MVEPFKIDPNTVYSDGQIRLSLGLTSSALNKARRDKSLRFSKQGKKVLYKGQWLLDWLESTASTISREAASC